MIPILVLENGNSVDSASEKAEDLAKQYAFVWCVEYDYPMMSKAAVSNFEVNPHMLEKFLAHIDFRIAPDLKAIHPAMVKPLETV